MAWTSLCQVGVAWPSLPSAGGVRGRDAGAGEAVPRQPPVLARPRGGGTSLFGGQPARGACPLPPALPQFLVAMLAAGEPVDHPRPVAVGLAGVGGVALADWVPVGSLLHLVLVRTDPVGRGVVGRWREAAVLRRPVPDLAVLWVVVAVAVGVVVVVVVVVVVAVARSGRLGPVVGRRLPAVALHRYGRVVVRGAVPCHAVALPRPRLPQDGEAEPGQGGQEVGGGSEGRGPRGAGPVLVLGGRGHVLRLLQQAADWGARVAEVRPRPLGARLAEVGLGRLALHQRPPGPAAPDTLGGLEAVPGPRHPVHASAREHARNEG